MLLIIGLVLLFYLWWGYYRFIPSAWRPYYKAWCKPPSEFQKELLAFAPRDKNAPLENSRITAAIYLFGDPNWNIWAPKLLRGRFVRWGMLVIGIVLVIIGIRQWQT
jgi:hypothetical protein